MPTLTLGELDAGEVFAPSTSQQNTATIGFIDSGAIFGPVVPIGAPEPPEPAVSARMTARSLAAGSTGAGTAIATMRLARITDQFNDHGDAEHIMQLDDAALSGIVSGSWIRYELDGTPIFTGVVDEIERTRVAQGDAAAQVARVKSYGLLSEWSRGTVYASRGPGVRPKEEMRPFSWASTTFDRSSWGYAAVYAIAGDPSLSWTGLPRNNPDASAAWIWAPGFSQAWAPAGMCLFAHEFTVPAGVGKIGIRFSVDYRFRLFFDGHQILQGNDATQMFGTEVFVTPGPHLICVEAENNHGALIPAVSTSESYTIIPGDTLWGIAERYYNDGFRWRDIYGANSSTIDSVAASRGFPGGGHWIFPGTVLTIPDVDTAPIPGSYNPGGVVGSVWSVGEDDRLLSLITHTDGSWLCLPYPVAVPGIPLGKIIRTLMQEEQSRGGLPGWVLAFSDTVDSAGNLWPVISDVSFPVGADLESALQQLGDSYIEIATATAARVLYAWNSEAGGSARAISYASSDLTRHNHVTDSRIVNRAYLRTAVGDMEFVQAESATAHGVRSQTLEVGWVETTAQGWEVATELFRNFDSSPERIDAQFVLGPSPDASDPGRGWFVRDHVGFPDETGSIVSVRVMSLTWSLDDDGKVTVDPQLITFEDFLLQRWRRWLKRMATGAGTGSTWLPSPTIPAPVPRSTRNPARFDDFYYDLPVTSSTLQFTHNGGTVSFIGVSLGQTVRESMIPPLRVNPGDVIAVIGEGKSAAQVARDPAVITAFVAIIEADGLGDGRLIGRIEAE